MQFAYTPTAQRPAMVDHSQQARGEVPHAYPTYDYYDAIDARLEEERGRPLYRDLIYDYEPSYMPNFLPYPIESFIPATPKEQAEAVSRWYVDQVYDLLVRPGQFRSGTGGADPDIWNETAVHKASLERMTGVTVTDFNDRWARLGSPTSPYFRSQLEYGRKSHLEDQDPYGLSYNWERNSERMYDFVQDIVHRMGISTTAIIAAFWFLQGLGFHEGDGTRGRALRRALKLAAHQENDAVLKRVCMLGLLLSGKWLDDNSFLNKSWNEVTHIRIKEIHQYEVLALNDYHWSLFFPRDLWMTYIETYVTLYAEHLRVYPHNRFGQIVFDILNNLLQEAQQQLQTEHDTALAQMFGFNAVEVESFEPVLQLGRRLSASEMPTAGDQAVGRDWSSYAQTYSIARDPRQSADVATVDGHEFESDLEAERNVAALVGDDSMETDETYDFDEVESEFLEYDGAQPFLSELQRSTSNQSGGTVDSHDAWVAAQPRSQHKPRENSTTQVEMLLQVQVEPDFSLDARMENDRTTAWVNSLHQAAEHMPHREDSHFNNTPQFEHAKFLEPGIAVVRPGPSSSPFAFAAPALTQRVVTTGLYDYLVPSNYDVPIIPEPAVDPSKSRWSQRWDPALRRL